MTSWTFLINCRNWINWIIYIYFLTDLDFWSILIFDIVTKKGGWYDYFNLVTFICAFPMQRALVKVLIFLYGFCLERGLLLWGTPMTSWTFLINCRNWINWIIYIWDTNQSFHTEKGVIFFLNCYSWKTFCMLIEIKRNSHIPVIFICAFPMQRAFVKVLIFHYGFCLERGL
jgi:hypothetical protein